MAFLPRPGSSYWWPVGGNCPEHEVDLEEGHRRASTS